MTDPNKHNVTGPPNRPQLPFVVDAFGRFPPSHVHVAIDHSPRPTTPELESLIEEEWQRQIELARQSDRSLFNGSLMRYVDHAVTGDTEPDSTPSSSDSLHFHMTVAPTCYRDFVGTNLFNHHRIEEFGWHRFANPIGTTATLITRDARICYGRRSDRVSYHAGHVHTFGGGLEENDRSPDGTIDPFGSLFRELAEELNLFRGDLFDPVCVGLIRDKEIHQPELLFEAHLGLTAEQLEDRWLSAEAQDEHSALVTFPNHPDSIVPFIKQCSPIAPVAVGALFLYGLSQWGEDWFESASGQL